MSVSSNPSAIAGADSAAAGGASGLISALFVYPVKSCAGVSLAESILTDSGLDLDRAWMVVDAQGVYVSQREQPRLALVRPQLKHYEVVLRAPGMLALHLQIEAVQEPVQVRIWSDTVSAFDMGDVAAQWFSDFLGARLRLVRFDPDHRRLSDLKWTGGVEATNQFNDGYPVLAISEASLALLNERLVAGGHGAVGMERFRPNIVLSGLEAHDEDRLEMLQVASDPAILLKPVKPCPRCPIPNIDPATALASPEVGDALQAYRRDDRLNGAISFGMNLIVAQGAEQTLRIGQAVSGAWRFD